MRRLIACVLLTTVAQGASAQEVMRAHFIDVGQGDATLLEFPCGAVLIDTGAQDPSHVEELLNYLTDVFDETPNLNHTLQAVYVTHAHIDHTRGLREVAETFTVERVIENGQRSGSGIGDVNWVRSQNIAVRVSDRQVRAGGQRQGLTDGDIDPIDCPAIDPKIRVLASRISSRPTGWSNKVFKNANNHSLVLRVDFGETSFLFTGDLQDKAIDRLVAYYNQGDLLDVDVYQVGHHGSHNGTTDDLMLAMTPDISVLSMGRWHFGRAGGTFTTWAYGHPREDIVSLLEKHTTGLRAHPRTFKVGSRARRFHNKKVRQAVYATGWGGTTIVTAKDDGSPLLVEASR